jgi:hypothetical protein
MKRLVSTAIGTAALAISVSAAAQDKKFDVGLRLGYALPLGNAWSAGTSGPFTFPEDAKMSNAFSGQIPIWIDAGYRVVPPLVLGLYFQYGFVSVKTATDPNSPGCPSGADCSAHDIRLGLQAEYDLLAGQSIDPWLGLGVGYEWLGLSETANGTTSSGNLSGFEFANLQGGVDFAVGDGVALGPFLSFSLGQYSTFHTEAQGVGVDIDVPKALHEWLAFGVRGRFGF